MYNIPNREKNYWFAYIFYFKHINLIKFRKSHSKQHLIFGNRGEIKKYLSITLTENSIGGGSSFSSLTTLRSESEVSVRQSRCGPRMFFLLPSSLLSTVTHHTCSKKSIQFLDLVLGN